jgi:hypothetical protein
MRPSILIATMFQLAGLAFPPALAEGTASSLPLIQSYLESAGARRAAIEGAVMEVEITARLPKLEKAAALKALRRVSCDGRVTYQALDFSGDARVKREVIARYLAAETAARDASSVAITPANYEFRLKAARGPDGQTVQIFRLKPRKKRVGLFKGELWLDAETGMPLRESGQFVKLPSIFLKRIRFVREYAIRGGVSIPTSIESTVETRLVGRAELSVRFYNFSDRAGCGCRESHFAAASESGGRR